MAAQLIFTVVLPVLTAAAFVLAEKRAFFRRLPYALRQVLIGAVFGGLVFAAATMAPTTRTSVQDMVPLTAGLLFGAPAGLVSGGMGALLLYWVCIRSVGDEHHTHAPVKADVDAFAGRQEQFDDIAMLRPTPRQEAVWSAAPTEQSMADAAAFVEENLAKFGVEGKAAGRMMVALDEIWCNITRYSHAGQAQLRLTRLGDSVTLSFRDDGIPYNPLQAPVPDVTLSAEEREVGGLGIFMVRNLMSQVDYQYKDNRNCLTLTLRL